MGAFALSTVSGDGEQPVSPAARITDAALLPSMRGGSWQMDYLESPSYFQLHKARLIIRESAPQRAEDVICRVVQYGWGKLFIPKISSSPY